MAAANRRRLVWAGTGLSGVDEILARAGGKPGECGGQHKSSQGLHSAAMTTHLELLPLGGWRLAEKRRAKRTEGMFQVCGGGDRCLRRTRPQTPEPCLR